MINVILFMATLKNNITSNPMAKTLPILIAVVAKEEVEKALAEMDCTALRNLRREKRYHLPLYTT
jgi:hypothetical protein